MQDRSLVTINKILEAARTLFISKPYADVSLKDISVKAGVTKGAIYYHFDTKEALYTHMMLHYLEEIETNTRKAIEKTCDEPIEVRMYTSLVEFLHLPDEMINLVALIRRNSNIFEGPDRQKLIEAYQAALPSLLEHIFIDGIERDEIIEGDTRLMTWQYFALVEVSLHPYSRKVFDSSEALVEFVVSSFFNGIKKRCGEPAEDKKLGSKTISEMAAPFIG